MLASTQRHTPLMPGLPDVVMRDAFIAKHTDRAMLDYLTAAVPRVQRHVAELGPADAANFARLFLPPELLRLVVEPTNVALARIGQPGTTVPELVRFIQTTLALQLAVVSKGRFFSRHKPHIGAHILCEDRFDTLRQCVCACDTGEPDPLTCDAGAAVDAPHLAVLEDTIASVNTRLLLGSYAGDVALRIDDDLNR